MPSGVSSKRPGEDHRERETEHNNRDDQLGRPVRNLEHRKRSVAIWINSHATTAYATATR
jgi:hypothetical protein